MARKSGKPDHDGKKADRQKIGSGTKGELAPPEVRPAAECEVDEAIDAKPGKKGSRKAHQVDTPKTPQVTGENGVESPKQPIRRSPSRDAIASGPTDESSPTNGTDRPAPSPQPEAVKPTPAIRAAVPVSRDTGEPLSELFKRGYVSPPNPAPARREDRATRTEDDAPRAAVPRQYKAPMLRLPDADRPSMALSAFRLGRLGVAMTAEAEILWDDLTRRLAGNLSHPGAFTLIPTAAEQLLVARRVLINVITPHVYVHLEGMIGWFTAFNQRMIEQLDRGEFDPFALDDGSPKWEIHSRELESACYKALPLNHGLRPLFDLGAAFGEFSVMTNNHYSSLLNDESEEDEPWQRPNENGERCRPDLDEQAGRSAPRAELKSRPYDRFPEIGKMTKLASSLPTRILDRSRLLKSLAGIAGDHARIGEEKAFERYQDENRPFWADRGVTRSPELAKRSFVASLGPDVEPIRFRFNNASDHDVLLLRRIDLEQIRLVEAGLSTIPDDSWAFQADSGDEGSRGVSSKPRWDKEARRLWFRGERTKKLRSDGETAILILAVFEELKWQTRVDSPFPGGGKATSEAPLVNGVKTLNRFAEKLGIQFEYIDLKAVEWHEL